MYKALFARQGILRLDCYFYVARRGGQFCSHRRGDPTAIRRAGGAVFAGDYARGIYAVVLAELAWLFSAVFCGALGALCYCLLAACFSHHGEKTPIARPPAEGARCQENNRAKDSFLCPCFKIPYSRRYGAIDKNLRYGFLLGCTYGFQIRFSNALAWISI